MTIGIKKLEIIVKPGKMEAVKKALAGAGGTGVTISQAEGHGLQNGASHDRQGGTFKLDLVPKIRIEAVVTATSLESVIEAVVKAARTGEPGDGKIFVYDVVDAVRVRTGERGAAAV